tara:strand:+ start:318 stop:602 length:285 start_codon:yes stop_codon:yes gene_type:complete
LAVDHRAKSFRPAYLRQNHDNAATTQQRLNNNSTTTQQQLNNNYATNKLRHIAISYFLMVNHDKRHRYIKLAKLAQRPVLMFVRITALSTCSTK